MYKTSKQCEVARCKVQSIEFRTGVMVPTLQVSFLILVCVSWHFQKKMAILCKSMSKFDNYSQQQSGSGFSDIFPVVKQVDNISTISQDHLTSPPSPATHLNVLRYHQHLTGYLTHYTLHIIPTRQFYPMSHSFLSSR